MNKLAILSIDGGGLRGIVPLNIIQHIEAKYGQPIHEIFDVVAGTSTGALLACSLLIEDPKSEIGGQRKYSLDDVSKIYTEKGKVIFPPANSLLEWFYWITRKFGPRYNKNNIERVLKEYLNDQHILDCMLPIFITSYDVHRDRPVFFTSRQAIEMDHNLLLRDVCRATSAAPTYFPTHKLTYGEDNLFCIDGGIIMNNPAMGVLFEVLNNSKYKYYNIPQGLNIDRIHLLSLGTGISNRTINGEKTTGWGEVRWARQAIDIAMTGTSGIVHEQVKMIYKAIDKESNYLRLNVRIDEEYSEMSDSRTQTMNHLKDKVKEQIVDNQSANLYLDQFINELRK